MYVLLGPQPGQVYTFPSTELRAIDVKMQPVMPLAPLNVVANEVRPEQARPSRPARGAAQRAIHAVRNIVYTARQRQAPPKNHSCGRFHLVKKRQYCSVAYDDCYDS